MRHPAILGIDPGTTTSFVLLTFAGTCIAMQSRRNYQLPQLIADISTYGNVHLVGTDTRTIPKVVAKIAAVYQSKIVTPRTNLTQRKKMTVAKNYLKSHAVNIQNKHQRDALVAAILAWKRHRRLFMKVTRKVYPKWHQEIMQAVLNTNQTIYDLMKLPHFRDGASPP